MKKLKQKATKKPQAVLNPTNVLADRKAAFIREIALFLTTDQGKWSIKLEMGNEDAKRWAAIRMTTPLMGYPTFDEAYALLTQFLA